MRTIIIASDFSNEAKNATEYVIKLSERVDVKLVVFHLHKISIHSENARLPYLVVKESIEKSHGELEKRIKSLSDEYGVFIEFDWAMGDFYEQLQLSVERHQADVVVMGMDDKSLEQDLLGSTTTGAIHKIKVPILAIPLKAKFTGIKKVLFACDIEKGVDMEVLDKVKEAVFNLNAELEVFHVSNSLDKIEQNKHVLKGINKGFEGISYMYKEVKSDAVIHEIEEELKRIEADLLIMVPYEYGFWSSLVHKSKTRVMISGMDIPLLSIHA
ncbi:universal stress protein [Confluentibacter sediminis]|uniref:universal stress protein n=1 Tax=Confluentibacter sediminis TaxID=2219045 RepID=UPI000DAE4BE9|nr:universal stress protein [Confluentibacter sediminis]